MDSIFTAIRVWRRTSSVVPGIYYSLQKHPPQRPPGQHGGLSASLRDPRAGPLRSRQRPAHTRTAATHTHAQPQRASLAQQPSQHLSPLAHRKKRRKGEISQATRATARTRPSTYLQPRHDHTRPMPQRIPAHEVYNGSNSCTKQPHEHAMIFCHPAAGSESPCHFNMYGP